MGLFIGASILTILELFDYIYEVRPFTLHPLAGCGVVTDQDPPMCPHRLLILISSTI